jgi:tetratricopeptide (TPR) repeat protein
MPTPATLSLCMIVRNEAELLPRFLDCAAGLWTELCVVDTGSTDDSVAMLERAGARVLRRAWDDDFAAARNAGLEQATGDWILFLDADEMVSPALHAQIGALRSDETAGAATVVMRNLLPHGHRRENPLLRAFRNDPAIRFRYPIHEDVTCAVRRNLQATGRRLRHLPGVVEHLGYVRSRATSREKKARDMDLLMRCLERDRGDLYSWFKLLELARFWDDRPLQREAAAQAAMAAGGPLALAGKPFGGPLVALAADGAHPDDPAAALAVIAAWADLIDPDAALYLRRGELRELAGQPAEAAADFRRCLELEPVTADHQLATVRPSMGLARLALAAGDRDAAGRHADQALGHNARDPEALLLSFLLAHGRGGDAAALELAMRLRADHGHAVEIDEAMGEAALALGRPVQAAIAFRQAAGDPPGGRAAIRLAQALLAAGDADSARQLSEALAPSLPEAALGLLACDLVAGRDSDLVLEIEDDVAHRAFRSWVDALRGAATPDVLARFRRAAPAVAAVFPWLAARIAPSG